MYYEVYVDVLFLVNVVLDYFLLLLVKKMMKCTATHGNIFAGALSGSALTCIVMLLPVPFASVKFVLFHVVVNTLMIHIGLKIKKGREFAKAFLTLYAGGFLMGGVLEYLRQYIDLRFGSLFFVTALVGYSIASSIWNFLSKMQKINQYRCQVQLFFEEKQCEVQAMIDSGNGLREPLTDQPVSILDRKTAQDFFQIEHIETYIKNSGKIRYIPYQSIGKKEGVLLAIQIEKMCVYKDGVHWIQKPWISISEEDISSAGTYQMILSPDLF